MTRSVQAFLPVEPPSVTHNSLVIRYRDMGAKGRKPYIGKSDALRRVEDDLRPHVARLSPGTPLKGTLRETVKLVWPCDDAHPSGSAKNTKPDADNIVKTLNDLLQTCHVIADDAMVCDMRIVKMYGEVAGIWVRVEEMG